MAKPESEKQIVSDKQPATLHAINVALNRKQKSRDIIIKNYDSELTAINGEINELLASKKSLLERELELIEQEKEA